MTTNAPKKSQFTQTVKVLGYEPGTTKNGIPMSRVKAEFPKTSGGTYVQSFDIAGAALAQAKSKIRKGRSVALAFVRTTYADKRSFLDAVGLAWTKEERAERAAARAAAIANDNAEPAADAA